MIRFIITSILLASGISAAEQNNTLNPPKGWNTWPLADDCTTARAVYEGRNNREFVEEFLKTPRNLFKNNTAVEVLDEDASGCVMVQTPVANVWGWVPTSLLLKPTPGQLAATAGVVAEKERATRAAAAEKDRAAHVAYLRSLPTVSNGNVAIFLGADRKCSEQFVQALSMDGLEKRKKMADLVTFGCGYLADAGVHVKRLETESTYCRVAPAEGKQEGKPGWVPCSWVK